MLFENLLKTDVLKAIKALYNTDFAPDKISIQPTNKEFTGDATLVVFPLLKISKQSPEITATAIGEWMKANSDLIENFNVIKGFLNLIFNQNKIIQAFKEPALFDTNKVGPAETTLVEYSSPNSNKPLHLGHLRTILLGYSVYEILKANGSTVYKVNIVNDRGVHICKSMLAWQKFGNGETPASSGMKGDHLVGKYYVEFDKAFKREVQELIDKGVPKEEADKKASMMIEVQQMLRDWELGDKATLDLWNEMNGWVYDGFNSTYKMLGVDFDKIYYESKTYLLGKELVKEGLQKGVFYKKDDGSIWVDLTEDGLDQKVLLRSDGTAVYITQDIGTAKLRYDEYHFDKMIYVVGNEQEYHFKVLKLVLKKLGYEWWNKLHHMAYNMIDLPSGKMKSREGTVVDADDLIASTIDDAEKMTRESGKITNFDSEEAKRLFRTVGLGALKYFILKVDPEKRMLFNPAESIDINGNTGPFIQYAYARIQSVVRKANAAEVFASQLNIPASSLVIDTINDKEKDIIKLLLTADELINEAAQRLSPALIASYAYDLAKAYNQFYHDNVVVDETNIQLSLFRIELSKQTANSIKKALSLLGIDVPERM